MKIYVDYLLRPRLRFHRLDLTCNTEIVVKEEPNDVSGEVNVFLDWGSEKGFMLWKFFLLEILWIHPVIHCLCQQFFPINNFIKIVNAYVGHWYFTITTLCIFGTMLNGSIPVAQRHGAGLKIWEIPTWLA